MKNNILFTLILFITTQSNAALIDYGSFVFDSTTNSDWLKLTETQNRSYNDVSSKFGSGQEFEGWRYATVWELDSMLKDQGITGISGGCGWGDLTLCGYDQANNGKVANIINTFGVLTTTTFSRGELRLNLYGWTGSDMSEFGDGLKGKVLGWMQDFEEGQPRFHDALINVNPGNSLSNLNEYQAYLGSWLVRESSVSTVPVPPALLLFISGLISLITLFKSKRT